MDQFQLEPYTTLSQKLFVWVGVLAPYCSTVYLVAFLCISFLYSTCLSVLFPHTVKGDDVTTEGKSLSLGDQIIKSIGWMSGFYSRKAVRLTMSQYTLPLPTPSLYPSSLSPPTYEPGPVTQCTEDIPELCG